MKQRLLEMFLENVPDFFIVVAPSTCTLPERFRDEPTVVLQLGHGLTRPPRVQLQPEGITAILSFSGSNTEVHIPWSALQGIFTRAVKIHFATETDDTPVPAKPPVSHLRVVK